MRKNKTTISILISTLLLLSLYTFSASAALIGDEGGFYYSLQQNNKAILEEYHGSEADIVIPDSIHSYTVNEIAENVFSKNETIKSVVIPNTIKELGGYAFFGCTNLEKAVIPSSINTINAATFYNCTNLREVTIPASVTKIAANAFYGCENLTIKGDRNTAAEAYALENGYNFEDLHLILVGDIDGDGTVTSGDALSVLRMSASLEDCSAETLPIADIDGDESITSGDALELLRYSASLPANERIGQPLYIEKW